MFLKEGDYWHYCNIFSYSRGADDGCEIEILLKNILHNSKTIRLHVCINFVFLYLQITYYVSATLIAILGYRFEKSLLTFF